VADESERIALRGFWRVALALAWLGIFLAGGGVAAAASGGAAIPAASSTSGLTVALESAGHVQYAFWRGNDGRIYEARYAGGWQGPLKTPWFASSRPSAAVAPHGILYLVWRGTGNHIFEASYHRRWSKPTDLTKTGKWSTKGQAISSVSLAINPRNGNQLLMWRSIDGHVHEAWRTKKWHGPLVMPWTVRNAPTVSVTRSGHQYVFWTAANGDLEEAWYQGHWHGPADLTQANGWGEFGQATSLPGVGVNPADGSQYVFWSAMDGRMYEAWYAKGWHGPVNTGWSTTSPPALAVTPGGRQYVFWQGPDATTWESWHDTAWHGPIAPLRPHAAAPGTDVAVTQTTADFYERLARLANIRFTGAGTGGLPTIQVDDTQRFQRYVGAGGAMTDTSAWLIYDELSPVTRAALMNDLFGPLGAHLNFTVVPMGGSDFTRTGQPYTYDDVPAGQTDPQLTQFSISHDEPYILPALRQMLSVNPKTTVMGTPWTAPPWMKANDNYDDKHMAGSLNASAYQPFADYFVKFLQAYAEAGVPVGAIAPVNEPDSGAAFPAMNFPASGEAQWITQNLEPSLQAANLHPRLYGGDVGWAGPYYPGALETSQAADSLNGIAWHCYGGPPTVMSNLHAQAPSSDQILTECSQGITPYPVPEVLIGSLRNWSSVVTLWNLALDPNGGPVEPPNTGCPGCIGEVTIDETKQTVSFRLAYFQLGQVAAFVDPGAVRVGSNSFVSYYQTAPGKYGASPGLDDVAFLNPDGSHVLVAYNNAASTTRFAVQWNGRTFTYSLPAKAEVTFHWH
jgi:glucosylceramidase